MQEANERNGSLVAAMAGRYADAYVVARTVSTFGTALKFVAAGAFALIFAAGSVGVLLVMSAPGRLDVQRFIAAGLVGASGTAIASAAGLTLFILATLMAAQGQILGATLDSAVNSSRFINDEERARIMALPYESRANVVPVAAGLEAVPQRIPVGA